METFNAKFAPEGSSEYEYTIIPGDDGTFRILLEGAQVCVMKMNEHLAWEACEGSLTEEEIEFLSDKIESREM